MTDALWSFIKIAASLAFGLQTAALLTWVERKQSAVMQDRIGANRASIFGVTILGLFHPLADTLKMIAKEDFIPPNGIRPWHDLAPVVGAFFSMLCLAALPYGDQIQIHGRMWSLQPLPLSAGILFILAMLSMGVHGVVMAGWASGSNYSLLGGLRGAAQLISYEVALLTTLAGPLFLYGTLDLNEAVRWQGRVLWGFLPAWGVFLQPPAFILFLTAGAAETKRAPFDLPEGEAEIVGYFTEYSGMKFSMFLMTDFIETIILAGLTTALFLGGWQIPGLGPSGFALGGLSIALPQPAVALLQVCAFVVKTMAMLWALMLIRWTLPRFRFDQLLDLGWKNLLPLSLLNFFATAWAVYWLRP